MESVLILDGNQRSALAAARSLGRRDVRVIVADTKERSLSSTSRFCRARFGYPSPRLDPTAFIACLAEQCRRHRVDVLYPMSDITMYHVLKNRSRLGDVVIPYGPLEAYEELSDKWRFFKLTAELNLPTPRTHFIEATDDLRCIAGDLRFPVVIKPYRSQLLANGRWLHAKVHYADSLDELRTVVNGVEYFSGQRYLLQEYIHGENQGIFALSNRGTPQSYFANRRIRDVPPEGGIVVLAESIPMNPHTRTIAARLLAHVGWHGVAMVECKIQNGLPYILETNARFWASTQLAVDCGVDYPWLLYQVATGRTPDDVRVYEEHRRLRDLVGDVEHYYMTVAGIGLNRYEPDVVRQNALRGFWKITESGTYYEKNRWSDLGPFAHELRQAVRQIRPLRMLRHIASGIAQRLRRSISRRAFLGQA